VTANLTVGTVMVTVLGLGCLTCGLFFERTRAHPVLAGIAGVVALAVVGFSVFLAGYGRSDNVTNDEDAVIVLGAAVHGSELSSTLAGRLAVAVECHLRNPDALIVVSGGQGLQEDLPEAVAMRQYLLEHGVPGEQIVLEDRSTSTEENFANSKVLLDARLPPAYTVVFVTDEFHVYRAGGIAAAAGLVAHHASSRTPWYFWPANYLRETIAVALFWIGR
jgi:uncharacterized SAM-binding protein YcdF (DUF218 family)